jgi:hypothetical protein
VIYSHRLSKGSEIPLCYKSETMLAPTGIPKKISRRAVWKRKQAALREELFRRQCHIDFGGKVVSLPESGPAGTGSQSSGIGGSNSISTEAFLKGKKTPAAVIAARGMKEEQDQRDQKRLLELENRRILPEPESNFLEQEEKRKDSFSISGSENFETKEETAPRSKIVATPKV